MVCVPGPWWKLIAAATCGFTLILGPAHAALLTNIQGEVAIHTGQGFKSAGVPIDLKAGDRVRTGTGATAQIVYSETCIARVEPDTVVIVLEKPPCEPGAALQPGAAPPGALIVGGAVIVGGGIVILTQKPASP